jgi:hypothetical protein
MVIAKCQSHKLSRPPSDPKGHGKCIIVQMISNPDPKVFCSLTSNFVITKGKRKKQKPRYGYSQKKGRHKKLIQLGNQTDCVEVTEAPVTPDVTPAPVRAPKEEVQPSQSLLVPSHDNDSNSERVDASLKEFLSSEAKPVIDVKTSLRISIAFLFVQQYGAEKTEEAWIGQGGIIPSIRSSLGIPIGTNIKPILQDILECRRLGVTYTGNRRLSGKTLDRTPFLTTDYIEAQIVADCIEDGQSICFTVMVVNHHCQKLENNPT